MGYVAVLKYFDALVVAVMFLSDQIVGNFLFRIVFRAAPQPHPITYIGTLAVAAGVVAMVLANRVKITHFNIRLRKTP